MYVCVCARELVVLWGGGRFLPLQDVCFTDCGVALQRQTISNAEGAGRRGNR